MVRLSQTAALLLLLLVTSEAAALSCGIPSERKLIDSSTNIFFAIVTSSKFVPYDDTAPGHGKIIAHFDVVEVFKGDADAVPHIEAVVRGTDETWPAEIHLGKRYLIFAGDGPARFTACSGLFRDSGRKPWCLEYQVRKRIGQSIQESTICEAAFLYRELEQRGVTPKSNLSDLDGLRIEWTQAFGALPQ